MKTTVQEMPTSITTLANVSPGDCFQYPHDYDTVLMRCLVNTQGGDANNITYKGGFPCLVLDSQDQELMPAGLLFTVPPNTVVRPLAVLTGPVFERMRP